MCVGSRVHLVGVSISFEKNFYWLPFIPPSLVRHFGPSTRDRALGLQKELGFLNGEAVVAVGLSGGLALFWRRDVTLAVQTMSKFHIDVVLPYDELPVRQWCLTGIYGEPRRELQKIAGIC
jgi:hypothetical protein